MSKSVQKRQVSCPNDLLPATSTWLPCNGIQMKGNDGYYLLDPSWKAPPRHFFHFDHDYADLIIAPVLGFVAVAAILVFFLTDNIIIWSALGWYLMLMTSSHWRPPLLLTHVPHVIWRKRRGLLTFLTFLPNYSNQFVPIFKIQIWNHYYIKYQRAERKKLSYEHLWRPRKRGVHTATKAMPATSFATGAPAKTILKPSNRRGPSKRRPSLSPVWHVGAPFRTGGNVSSTQKKLGVKSLESFRQWRWRKWRQYKMTLYQNCRRTKSTLIFRPTIVGLD